jgi:NAD dependent epimerase/dehydratase family enzyme
VNILILGGSGFIGSNLLDRLDGSVHKIKVLLRKHTNKNIKFYPNVEKEMSNQILPRKKI